MKSTTLYIKKDQRLVNILTELQSNTIYDKFIPGTGATTLEIDSQRNSILILPFVPVIEGKQYDDNGKYREELIGVFGEMNKEHVTTYLEKMGKGFKKILCTPEKFGMVIGAIKDQGSDPYSEYFLLLDECEAVIKDIDFRPDIKLPMNEFFKFENKALISATPIIPRDSRFNMHNFSVVKIRPHEEFTDYKIDLDLKGTNNVVSVLRNFIKANSEETICIFTNCAKTITKIISDLKLEKEAKVFCSYRLFIKRFKVTGVKHIYTSLGKSKDGLAKVNFFTSRFFCAVDMIFPDIRPLIVMVTNVYYSDHSKIDPATDAIQISGRFRKGIKKMVHISNFNTDIPLKTADELKSDINELLGVYRFLNRYKDEPGTNDSRVKWINQILEGPPFIKMMSKGELDTYLADNIQHEQITNSYYSNFKKLKAAYLKTNYFNVNGTYKSLKVTDEDIMRRDAVAGVERRKIVAEMLNKFAIANGPFNLDLSYYEELQEFRMMDEVIYSAYFDLGIHALENSKFQLKSIKTALLNKHKERMKTSEVISEAVRITFVSNQTVTSQEVKEKLQIIYDTYSDQPITALGTDIKIYFETTEAHNIRRKGVIYRGYRLRELKYPKIETLLNPNAHIPAP